jgi:uncharacterized protein YegJ (DUF2314 family)
MITYAIDNSEETAAEFPDTFYIPPRIERESVEEGTIVKLVFRFETESEAFVERMWVIVKERKKDGSFVGVLDNDPNCTDEIQSGLEVSFGPEHIIEIWKN